MPPGLSARLVTWTFEKRPEQPGEDQWTLHRPNGVIAAVDPRSH